MEWGGYESFTCERCCDILEAEKGEDADEAEECE